MDLYDALNRIESCDPDGGQREPTDADHAAHRRWAIDEYGPDVWATYTRGGWAEPSAA